MTTSPLRNARSLPRKALTAILMSCAVLASTLLLAAPASAATANSGIYGVVPEWGGWCPDAGRLNNYATSVKYNNHTVGRNGGDSGDDIVWVPVRNGIRNSITMSVTCRWSTPIGMNFSIIPKRHGQTFWFRLNGTFSNN
jgi:hypothetical protein